MNGRALPQLAALCVSAAMALTCALSLPSPAAAAKRASIGSICGGIAGFRCKSGLFCDFMPEAQCGAADQTGVCRKRPQFCTREYRPVCGCDGKTYGNDCTRRAAGVGKIKDGPCGGR